MRRPTWMTLLLFSFSLILAACGPAQIITATPALGSDTPIAILEQPTLEKPALIGGPTETPSALSQYQVPVNYDPAYISVINGSKSEGELIIYSTMPEANWNLIIRTFNSHYPWIEVKTFTLDSAEVFQRHNAEIQEETRTADLIISSDTSGWNQFAVFDVLFYNSQEEIQLPEWSKSIFGTYTVFSEPMVIIYNKKLVPVPPNSMAELAALVQGDPKAYQRQIITYEVENNATGFSTNWFWINAKNKPGWDLLTSVGQARPRLMNSSSEMVEAIGKGEAKIGYFVPLNAVLPKLSLYRELGWSYIADGQPVLFPNMAVTKKGMSPNSAKLMLDYILSQEGQYLLAESGQIPYRSDISAATDLHLDKLTALLGDNNVILGSLDNRLNDPVLQENFIAQWKAALGQ